MNHPKPNTNSSPFPQLQQLQQQQLNQHQQQQLNFLAAASRNPESHHILLPPSHAILPTNKIGGEPLALGSGRPPSQQPPPPPPSSVQMLMADATAQLLASKAAEQQKTIQDLIASQQQQIINNNNSSNNNNNNNNNNSASPVNIAAAASSSVHQTHTTTVKVTYQNHHQKDDVGGLPTGHLAAAAPPSAASSSVQPAQQQVPAPVFEQTTTTTKSSSTVQVTIGGNTGNAQIVQPAASADQPAPAPPAALPVVAPPPLRITSPVKAPPLVQSTPPKSVPVTANVAPPAVQAAKEKKDVTPTPTVPAAGTNLVLTPSRATVQKSPATKQSPASITVTTPSKTTMKLATVTTPRIKQTARKNQNPLQQQRSPTNLASISSATKSPETGVKSAVSNSNSSTNAVTPATPKKQQQAAAASVPQSVTVTPPGKVAEEKVEKSTPVSRKRVEPQKSHATPTSSGGGKTKRNRVQTVPYQSPLPELALIQRMSANESPVGCSSNGGDGQEAEKLILFYKNEFVAVRNAEDGFFLCQILQNVYKSSPKIRIRWLSETKAKSQVYVPDFYDVTDLECILTSVNLDKEKQQYKLPSDELARIENILKKAMGLLTISEITEDNPDGLDLSLYKDESQLDRKDKKQKSESGDGSAPATPKQQQQSSSRSRSTTINSGSKAAAANSSERDSPTRVSKRGRAIQGGTPNYREDDDADEEPLIKREQPAKKLKKEASPAKATKELTTPQNDKKAAISKRKAEVIDEMKKAIESTPAKDAISPPLAKKAKGETKAVAVSPKKVAVQKVAAAPITSPPKVKTTVSAADQHPESTKKKELTPKGLVAKKAAVTPPQKAAATPVSTKKSPARQTRSKK